MSVPLFALPIDLFIFFYYLGIVFNLLVYTSCFLEVDFCKTNNHI